MIVIIGGGLSGLVTAYALKKEGIPFKIVEARNRLGGRIHTVTGVNDTPVEMGATWFTSEHSNLIALLNELGLEYYEQHMDHAVFYQTTKLGTPPIMEIPPQAPSFRISGGSSELIKRLTSAISDADVFLNEPVKSIKVTDREVLVTAHSEFKASSLVLAIPPKLWANKIAMEPSFPIDLIQVAQKTHTWMEDSIKLAITYDSPFWQENDIPGTLFSNTGPVNEFYDHCNHQRNKFALCGFVNSAYQHLSQTERKTQVLSQLSAVFGGKAKNYVAYQECKWSAEEHTFNDATTFLYPHQNNGNPIFRKPLFDKRVWVSSSESAAQFPGYMDGAVSAGLAIAERITASID